VLLVVVLLLLRLLGLHSLFLGRVGFVLEHFAGAGQVPDLLPGGGIHPVAHLARDASAGRGRSILRVVHHVRVVDQSLRQDKLAALLALASRGTLPMPIPKLAWMVNTYTEREREGEKMALDVAHTRDCDCDGDGLGLD